MATKYEIQPHEQTGYVYGLHSGDDVVKYVGRTTRLKARMTEHVIHARNFHGTIGSRLAIWINSIEILHVKLFEICAPESTLSDLERKWIVSIGMANLLNESTGAKRVEHRVGVSDGRKNGRAIFDSDQVSKIRNRVFRGETRISLAREMGVHRDTIEQIVRRDTYA